MHSIIAEMNYTVLDAGPGPNALFLVGGLVIGVLTLVVHITFANAVFSHATSGHFETVLVSPGIWALATLLLGPFGAGLYWVMHLSTLAPPPPPPPTTPQVPADPPGDPRRGPPSGP